MRIIPKEEAKDILFHAKGKESAMSLWIKKLDVGEVLEIAKADWVGKKTPYPIANYIAKTTGRTFKCGRLGGFEGWLIKRLS